MPSLLRTVEPDGSDQDLAFLSRLLAHHRIVAMGEATHGTHDFFQFKRRVFEYLVKRQGFTAFAMETPLLEGALLNDYVHGGQGDPVSVLANSYWCWNTQEVLGLVEWMRQYNLDLHHQRKLNFYGFDTQKAFTYGFPALRQYFDRIDNIFTPRLSNIEAQVNEQRRLLSGKSGREQAIQHKEEVAGKLRTVIEQLQNNQVLYVSRSTANEWSMMLRAAQMMLRAAQMMLLAQKDVFEMGFSAGNELRDRGMADNVGWILNQEGANSKVFVWAHNSHLNRDPEYRPNYLDSPYRPKEIPAGEPTTKQMGSFLKAIHKEDLYTIGFEFDGGTFQTQFFDSPGSKPVVKPVALEPAPRDTLPYVLTQVGTPLYFVDFSHAARSQVVEKWLVKKQKAHFYGGMMTAQRSFELIRLARSYDGLVFVKQTRRAVPLEAISEKSP